MNGPSTATAEFGVVAVTGLCQVGISQDGDSIRVNSTAASGLRKTYGDKTVLDDGTRGS